MAALTAGHQQGTGGGNTGWSAHTEAVKMLGPEDITQDFSKKLLKWQADVGGGVNQVRDVKNTSGGSGKFAGICGYGKRGRGVKNLLLYVKIQ